MKYFEDNDLCSRVQVLNFSLFPLFSQDNYFEETLKMRNLLEEFHREPAPTILGIREHIFTGRYNLP